MTIFLANIQSIPQNKSRHMNLLPIKSYVIRLLFGNATKVVKFKPLESLNA